MKYAVYLVLVEDTPDGLDVPSADTIEMVAMDLEREDAELVMGVAKDEGRGVSPEGR